MAHVELSLSEAFAPPVAPIPEPPADSFDSWCATVSGAVEPCLLIDLERVILAVSPSCCELLGLSAPARIVGRRLLDGGLRLLDFTATRGELPEPETEKIPPLLALSSGRMARGLLRVAGGLQRDSDATVDAIATPLLRDGALAGSLTFFLEV
ncbi:hypothetical protein O7627_00205 [Solwaraspora sp. WMMD1047]|uniref:hypothetical protein n=1 Tax=Solwaraspora sp. WMMD1047 TaxID=3016102 RepID=UPI0024175FE9|nr:hypothetical protein [Solwaraspora sp. WMMD1047]MDG4827725.1 hypothetical protein [Solwaraspora sp. WMMD1047]